MAVEETILSGFAVTLIYGAFHVFLVCLLALTITIKTKAQGDSISFKKFIQKVWYLRGVFTPLLVHIYDTATDIGVLYEWYFLAEYEKEEGNNIESLDMELLFEVGLIFMLVYRGGLGLVGGVGSAVVGTDMADKLRDRSDCIHKATPTGSCGHVILVILCLLFGFIVGFVIGALELGVFVAIYIDQEDHFDSGSIASNEVVYKPGEFQKAAQLAEGVLESMPEVILQSVFIIRSYNSSYLLANEGTIFGLIILSIIASIFSIANKYVWIDQLMVYDSAQSLFFKKSWDNKYSHWRYYSFLKGKFVSESESEGKFSRETSEALGWILLYHGEHLMQFDELTGEASAINDFKIDPNWLTKTFDNNSSNNNNNDNKDNVEDSGMAATTKEKEKEIIKSEEQLAQEKAIVQGARLLKKYYVRRVGDEFENLKEKGKEKVDDVIKELKILIEHWNNNDDLRHKMIKYLSKFDRRRTYLAYPVPCHQKYYFSIGYIIRVIWRLAAVTSRFVIFSLIWVVLGGAFEVVLVPTMVFVWYMVILFYTNAQCGLAIENKRMSCVGSKQILGIIKEFFDSTNCHDEDCCDNVFCQSFVLFWQTVIFIIAVCLFGITFQLGILGIAGRTLYIFRMIENVVLFGIIVLFAFDKNIDCAYCADPIYRNAFENERIKIWLIIGGISISIHILSSFVVSTLIDDDYDFDFTRMIEVEMEKIKREHELKMKQKWLGKSSEKKTVQEKSVALAINVNSVA